MAKELAQNKDWQEFEAALADYRANSGREISDPDGVLAMVYDQSHYTGTIMVEAHLHKCNSVHRKPRIRDGKAYVTYLGLEYQVVRAVQVYKSIYHFHISRGDFLNQ